MLATVPSCGATTGVSIFMISNTRIVSPLLTACPTDASTLKTLPAAPASTFTLPAAPAAGAGAAAFGATAGAAARLGAAAGALTLQFSYTVTT